MRSILTLLTAAWLLAPARAQSPCDSLLQASFTPQWVQGNSYLFANTSYSAEPDNTTYYWTFGDGGVQNAFTGTHTFAQSGTYLVCLHEVLDSCVSSTCHEVQVIGDGPLCNSEFVSYSVNNPDSVHFYPMQTDADSYLWHFGDGTTSDQLYPWHLYPGPGTYIACLTVTNELNGQTCTATWCDTVVVAGDGPECNAHFQFYSLQNPDSVHFYPSQTDADSYLWNFGDGTTSDQQHPWHLYPGPGTYIACLTVTNELNGQTCAATWCDTVVVAGDGPLCNAEFGSYSINNPDSVHFYPMQTDANSYLWHFGDGTTSDQLYPWHLYPGPGTYIACLTVTNELNGQTCTATWCDTVVVAGDGPECNAHFQFYSLQNPDSVHFYPSQTDADSYLWNFGDGSTSDHHDPWHLYSEPGTYITCLTVTNELNGQTCTDTWCDTVQVIANSVTATSMEGTLSVWPQPFDEQLQLTGGVVNSIDRWILIDMSGRVLNDGRVVNNTGTLMLRFATLPSGAYVLRLQGKEMDRSIRVMKR